MSRPKSPTRSSGATSISPAKATRNAHTRATRVRRARATVVPPTPLLTRDARTHLPDGHPQAATAAPGRRPSAKAVKAAVRALPLPAHIARPRGHDATAGNTGAQGGQETPEWAGDAKAGARAISPDRKRVGRPRFEPTTDQRRQVESMAGMGIPQAGIASMIINPHTDKGIDETTLREHFEQELEQGVHKANGKVGQSLFQKAMGNGHQSVAAAIFWLKCRAGWRERVDVAVDIKGGVLIPPASMTPEQWIAAQAALNASRSEPGKSE